jgi:hypothetical protein
VWILGRESVLPHDSAGIGRIALVEYCWEERVEAMVLQNIQAGLNPFLRIKMFAVVNMLPALVLAMPISVAWTAFFA